VMFSDADLLGVPLRIIVSPKAITESGFEIVTRDKSINVRVSENEIIPTVKSAIKDLICEIESKLLS